MSTNALKEKERKLNTGKPTLIRRGSYLHDTCKSHTHVMFQQIIVRNTQKRQGNLDDYSERDCNSNLGLG